MRTVLNVWSIVSSNTQCYQGWAQRQRILRQKWQNNQKKTLRSKSKSGSGHHDLLIYLTPLRLPWCFLSLYGSFNLYLTKNFLKIIRSIGELEINIYTHTCIHTNAHMHTHMFIHKHAAHTHIYIHVHTNIFLLQLSLSWLSPQVGHEESKLHFVLLLSFNFYDALLWFYEISFSGTTFPWAKCSPPNKIG